MPRIPFLLVLLSGSAAAQEHLSTLWPPKGRQEERFGSALACDGQRLVVASGRQEAPGVLFVYRREGSNWIEENRLRNRPDSQFDRVDGFGTTAEIDGDRILGSASFTAGEVYVFDRQPDGSWARTTIPAPAPATEFGFGRTLQLEGDTLVAATVPRPAGLPDDAVYVFELVGGVWTRTKELRNLHVREASLAGDALVLSTQSPNTGLQFYERAGADWVLEQSLQTSAIPSLARDGNVLAAQVGRLTTFYERVGQDWVVRGTSPAAGSGIALDAERFYVRKIGTVFEPPWIEVWQRDAAWNWTLVGRLEADILGDTERTSFGSDFALFHSDLIVGDPTFYGTTVRSGAVVTYSYAGRATLTATMHASILTGSALTLELDAGPEHAGRPFVLAGSLEGSAPGFFLGSHHVPLVREPLYYPVSRQVGILDGSGRATLGLNVPPLTPAFSHRTLHHAFVVLDPVLGLVHTSNVALTALNYRLIP